MLSYRKGYLAERDLVKVLGSRYDAHRVPLSGAVTGYEGDIILHRDDKTYICEVKIRKDAFRKIYRFVDKYDLVENGYRITTLERWLEDTYAPVMEFKIPKTIKDWLIDRDLLFFRSNYRSWLICEKDSSGQVS